MSNYCNSCYYNKNKKLEDDACPFNSLYWNFLDDKRSYLQNNFRMGMMYKLLDKMDRNDLMRIKEKANHIIEHQDEY
jgi:deoxyribodipyrimidine photolyase-related protein